MFWSEIKSCGLQSNLGNGPPLSALSIWRAQKSACRSGENSVIRASVHLLLAFVVFAAIVWGSMGLWDVATASLGHTVEWRAILAFGFMRAGVTGLALMYNEIQNSSTD